MPSSPTPTWAPELLARAYYSDDSVVLIHGDCLELADLWTCADVLVTDPPYGMAYDSGRVKGRSTVIVGDGDTTIRESLLDLWLPRPALVFGTWRQPRPAGLRHVLIWDKGDDPGTGDLTMPWGNSHEEVYVFGKGFVGKRGPAVLRCPKPPVNDRDAHPTPKPAALMSALIAKCPPGTIADPFAGSGSTLVAAKALGRQSIGVEIDERYCEIAARRLSQDVLDFGDPA